MSRLDVIKKRASTTALNQAAWTGNYRADVSYLLSELGKANKSVEVYEVAFKNIHGYLSLEGLDEQAKYIENIIKKAPTE